MTCASRRPQPARRLRAAANRPGQRLSLRFQGRTSGAPGPAARRIGSWRRGVPKGAVREKRRVNDHQAKALSGNGRRRSAPVASALPRLSARGRAEDAAPSAGGASPAFRRPVVSPLRESSAPRQPIRAGWPGLRQVCRSPGERRRHRAGTPRIVRVGLSANKGTEDPF